MIITQHKIVEALLTIKHVCQDNDIDCPICPLGREDGTCMIHNDIPDCWKIADLPELWRALK